MRPLHSLLILLLMAACSPPPDLPTPTAVPPPIPTNPPPAGTTLYEGCAYTVSYPPQLIQEGGGWNAIFTAADADPSVALDIWADHQTGAAADSVAEQLARGTPGFAGSLDLKPVTVIDFRGAALSGVRAEFTAGEKHVSMLVVVRPETLLGDMMPADVVYTVIAQSAVESWPQWQPHFEVIFDTFHPWDCGGV